MVARLVRYGPVRQKKNFSINRAISARARAAYEPHNRVPIRLSPHPLGIPLSPHTVTKRTNGGETPHWVPIGYPLGSPASPQLSGSMMDTVL
jgi:hypothetical protein